MRQRDTDARPDTDAYTPIDLTPPVNPMSPGAPLGYQPPTRRPRRSHPVLVGIGCGLVGLVVGITIGGAGKTSSPTSNAPAAPATSATAPATTSARAAAGAAKAAGAPTHAATSAAAAAGPRVVFTKSGSGGLTTAPFTTGSTWSVVYSFDCSSFGASGIFQVGAADGSDFNGPDINQSGDKGSDTDYVYNDSGTHALTVNSVCDWTIKVVDGG